jgi:hypothetical protein
MNQTDPRVHLTQPSSEGLSDEALRAKAREAIRSGKLPSSPPKQVWGGQGAGADCTVCGAPVKPEELELEMEFAAAGDELGRGSHHVHPRCFAAWQLEMQSLGSLTLLAAVDGDKMPDGLSNGRNQGEST